MGDAIVVLFGAPIWREDDARRAAACALEMQLAMNELNTRNQADGLPGLEMGIGLHTGQVVVGNIGSPDRMKYGVVGSHMNLTSRIQSYTVGGQIFASEATRREVGPMLRIGKQLEIHAKGIEQPVAICEVLGIGGPYKLSLLQTREVLSVLDAVAPFVYATVDGTQVNSAPRRGVFTRLSLKQAEARFEEPLAPLTNLMLHLVDPGGCEICGALYCKVIEVRSSDASVATVRFTSVAPEAESMLRSLMSAPDIRYVDDEKPSGTVAH
jgi:adenylate cyclase